MTLLLILVLCVFGFIALCFAGAAIVAVFHHIPEILSLLFLWWLLHFVGCL